MYTWWNCIFLWEGNCYWSTTETSIMLNIWFSEKCHWICLKSLTGFLLKWIIQLKCLFGGKTSHKGSFYQPKHCAFLIGSPGSHLPFLHIVVFDPQKMYIWGFPKIVVPPNHPFVHRVFHYFHHPCWGKETTIWWSLTYLEDHPQKSRWCL